MVSVLFAASGAEGRLMAPITIETSLGESYQVSAKAYVTVVAAPAAAPAPTAAEPGASSDGARTATATNP
jgi:hypothetical protein